MDKTGIVVEVEKREDTGKGAARRLRRSGRVPGIVYGMGKDPFPVAAKTRRIGEILHGEAGRNTVFTLSLAGKQQTRAVMIKELQRDPVTDAVLHVDFIRVDLEKRVRVRVPIRLVGTPVGVKSEGGLVDFTQREVEVECLPMAIPDALEADISELHLGQHASVADLPTPKAVRVLDPPDTVVVVIVGRKVTEAEAAEEEAAAAAQAEEEAAKESQEPADQG